MTQRVRRAERLKRRRSDDRGFVYVRQSASVLEALDWYEKFGRGRDAPDALLPAPRHAVTAPALAEVLKREVSNG